MNQTTETNPLLYAVPEPKPTIPEGARIVSVYRGKRGCCCGCLGTHYEGEDLTARRIANVRRDLEDAETSELSLYLPSRPSEEGHLCRERNGRYVIAYFRLDGA